MASGTHEKKFVKHMYFVITVAVCLRCDGIFSGGYYEFTADSHEEATLKIGEH